MSDKIKYSIVVPTLNERENVVPLIRKIEQCGLENYEVIVVDENSPDGTCQAVTDYAVGKSHILGMLNDGTPGLSPSIVKGFQAAQGEYLCCMDGDLQHDVNDLVALLRCLANADFVIGSRYVAGGGFAEKWHPGRVLISRTAAVMANIILGVKVKDPMSGFFAIRKTAFESVQSRLHPQGFKIMLELLYLLTHADSTNRIVEHGITFGLRQHGKSKLNAKVIGQYFFMLLRLRRHGVSSTRDRQ